MDCTQASLSGIVAGTATVDAADNCRRPAARTADDDAVAVAVEAADTAAAAAAAVVAAAVVVAHPTCFAGGDSS